MVEDLEMAKMNNSDEADNESLTVEENYAAAIHSSV